MMVQTTSGTGCCRGYLFSLCFCDNSTDSHIIILSTTYSKKFFFHFCNACHVHALACACVCSYSVLCHVSTYACNCAPTHDVCMQACVCVWICMYAVVCPVMSGKASQTSPWCSAETADNCWPTRLSPK